MTFDPFESRLCRDLRNKLGQAFVLSIRQKHPGVFSNTAADFRKQTLPDECIAYIKLRQAHLEGILKTVGTLPDGRAGFFLTAAMLWNRSLFFEVHEWLEKNWQRASGDEKKCLQALIMAATVYELRLYQRTGPAQKLAKRALALTKATRHIFPAPFDPDALVRVLSHPEVNLPVF